MSNTRAPRLSIMCRCARGSRSAAAALGLGLAAEGALTMMATRWSPSDAHCSTSVRAIFSPPFRCFFVSTNDWSSSGIVISSVFVISTSHFSSTKAASPRPRGDRSGVTIVGRAGMSASVVSSYEIMYTLSAESGRIGRIVPFQS